MSNWRRAALGAASGWIAGVLLSGLALGAPAVERSTIETLAAAYGTAAAAAADGDFTQAREAFQNAQALRDFNREAIRLGSQVAEREMLLADGTADQILSGFARPSASLTNLLDKMQRHIETIYATLPSPPATSSQEALKQVRQQFDAAMIELTEREFPNCLEFVSRGATALEANRRLLGNDTDVARLITTVETARTAVKNQQFRIARRSLDEILGYLNK